MVGSLAFLNVLVTTFVVPFVGAATTQSLALPHDVSYVTTISSHLQRAAFSTDPTRGQVLAEQSGQPDLQIFITNNQLCVGDTEQLSYRITVRNYGDVAARDISVQWQLPTSTTTRSTDPAPDRTETTGRNFTQWLVPELVPGGVASYSVTLDVGQAPNIVTGDASVFYSDNVQRPYQTLATHTINGVCSDTPVPAGTTSPKQPAIVCAPEEPNCRPTAASLNLGENYRNALTPAGGPVYCDGDGCTGPQLGPQFAEAIADILPGECRVVEDDVISKPAFHDGLNRRGEPAAQYLFPLYESGQDFRQFASENDILGSAHYSFILNQLRPIADDNAGEHSKLVTDFLKQETMTVGELMTTFDTRATSWVQRVQQAQPSLSTDYQQLQQRRKDSQPFTPNNCGAGRFARMACQAIENAETSTARACGPPPSDGGLRGSLPQVYQAYDASLNARQATYPQTQGESLGDYIRQLLEWRAELSEAATAYRAGNPKPLTDYLGALHSDQGKNLSILLQAYLDHEAGDEAAVHQIRLADWEKALDQPKTEATACEKENVFAAPVATTWCEVGKEPELLLRTDPKGRSPAAPIPGGENAVIPQAGVLGEVCGGVDQQGNPKDPGPGDPYWAASCKCHCGEQVTCNGQLVRCEDLYQCTGDPRDQITHHDIHITSQAECLWEEDDHLSPDAPGNNPPRGSSGSAS